MGSRRVRILSHKKNWCTTKNRTRSGLIGSLYYTAQLSEAQADKIRFYFNYDMIGSPKPQFAVYANNDAHKAGGSILFDYLESKLKSNDTKPFYG